MTYWLGLGANRGPRLSTMRRALRALESEGYSITAVSSVYLTAPRDTDDPQDFTNAAVRIDTSDAPIDVLRVVKRIERELGRVDTGRYGPRPIDIDILMWSGGHYADDDLIIPHPRLAQRRFALVPLAEIAPDLVVEGRELTSLAEDLADDPEQAVQRQPDTLREGRP